MSTLLMVKAWKAH